MTLRKPAAVTIALAALSCGGGPGTLAAATGKTAPIITYTASGTFASVPASGADTLRLAGEPFSVSIAVSASTAPYKYGSNWAAYHQLKLTGTVHSGLLGATPVNIASTQASIIQAVSPGQFDQFTMEAPVKVVGISLNIEAVIVMPFGTLSKVLLYPFTAPVSLNPGDATMTYSDGGSTTVIAIQKGSLTGTVPNSAIATSLVRSGGALGLTLLPEGKTAMRGLSAALPSQEKVPVLYAIASGYFPGLDEVIVKFRGVGRSAATQKRRTV